MELIFVRHGDPDYSIDSLTPEGWIEAEALVDRFIHENISQFYVSPLGRAKDTASFTLKAMNRTAIEYPWLREFSAKINITDHEELMKSFPDRKYHDDQIFANVAWDMLPGEWTKNPDYFHPENWKQTAAVKNSDFLEQYEIVTSGFDSLLKEHGYIREGHYYRVEQANRDKLVFFCHYGVTCLLLSYLMGVSPFILWHSISFAPTAITTVITEERRQGIAYFRANKIGDISHLYVKGLTPSFACRFCETYDSTEERH